MSACFRNYGFGITEFVLSVYIVASVVVSILSLLLLILLSLLLFVLVILLLYTRIICLFCRYFNVIVTVSILPIFIIKVEPCTTYTLNDLVPCSTGIESYMNVKAKFLQRNIVN